MAKMVTFEMAMGELKSMFPEFDVDLLSEVLKANRGHMERTIDAILQMKGEAPINTEVGAPVPKVDQLARDEAVARALQHKLLEDDLAVHGLTVEQFIALQNSRRIRSGALPSPSDPRVATSPVYREGDYYDDNVDLDIINLDELKEKINQLGNGAKLKWKEFVSKLPSIGPKTSPGAATPTRTAAPLSSAASSRITTAAASASAAPAPLPPTDTSSSTTKPTDTEEVVVFDSSLTKRAVDTKHGNSAATLDSPPPLPPPSAASAFMDSDDEDTGTEHSNLIDRTKYPKSETKKDL